MLLIFEQYNNLCQMHYDHAPITEALIDIRIEPPSDLSVSSSYTNQAIYQYQLSRVSKSFNAGKRNCLLVKR